MSELYQHRMRKHFGQNFPHDAGVTHHILRVIHAHEGQYPLEIGSGQSALTEGLLGSGARLDVTELDQDLVPLLKLKFNLESYFSLHQGNAFKFDFTSLVESGEKSRVIDNLPYNISTPLILRLLEHAPVIEDMRFILQKEAVERLAATPGGEDRGRFSIMVQYHCRMEHLLNVGPGVLNPPPKVDSATTRLTPFAGLPHPTCDPRLPERVVRGTFNQCRKTLRNALKPLLSVEDIEIVEVGPTLRPEQLDLAASVCLADRLAELLGNHQSNGTLVRNQTSRMSDTQHQVNVRVNTRYLPERSAPEQNRFAFAYTVTIENQNEVPAQLPSRYWIVTGGGGRTQEVRGTGVVGE